MGGRVVWAWFAVFAIAVALAVTVVADLANPKPGDTTGGAFGALVLFLAIAAGSGIVLYRRTLGGSVSRLATQRRSATLDRQQRVLHAAEQAGGRITLAQVVAHANVSIADAEELLAGMERDGMVTSRVSNEGAVVYYFPGLAPASSAAEDA